MQAVKSIQAGERTQGYMSKIYRFDYVIGEPITNGQFKTRRGSRRVTGYDLYSAASNLRNTLAKKWALPIQLEIVGGAVRRVEGVVSDLNPKLFPIFP